MKKILSIILTFGLIFSLTACGGNDSGDTNEGTTTEDTTTDDAAAEDGAADDTATENTGSGDGTYEIALITDIGTIDDKSFNQGAWEGVKQYAEENGVSYQYYQPASTDTDTLISTIELAISGGAKVVVCPGFLFEAAIYQAQTEHPDISFILLDGEPHSEDYETYETTENTYPILYAEEQAGFLAGYAAVKDGYTELGFMGGMAVPAVKRFGLGYIQGADYAASELGTDVSIMYNYTGDFAATPEAQTLASSWYSAGTKVIFGCGGAVGNSVMAAAEGAGTFVIGVDVDQSNESETVITSAMKNLSKSVYDTLGDIYNEVPGGETVTLDVASKGVGLPIENSRFNTFSEDDYNAIYDKLVSGDVTVDNNFTSESNPDSNNPNDILTALEKTTVTWVE